MNNQTPLRIVVADGMELVAQAIRSLVEEQDDLEVSAVTNNLQDAIRYTAGHKPDVLLVESPGVVNEETLPLLSEKIRQNSPETQIVMIAVKGDTQVVQKGLDQGISNYAVKEEEPGQLLDSIRKACLGQAYLSPSMMTSLVQSQRGDHAGLTGRELDVLKLIGYGHTNMEIGKLMHLSVRTIESHRANLQEKLGTHSRAELVREALSRQLVS